VVNTGQIGGHIGWGKGKVSPQSRVELRRLAVMEEGRPEMANSRGRKGIQPQDPPSRIRMISISAGAKECNKVGSGKMKF